MEYITVIILTVDAMLAIMAVIFSISSDKAQKELNELYEKTIEKHKKEYEKLHKKYMKALDFKSNIRLIVWQAKANKELCWDTLDKIKKELVSDYQSLN